MRLRLLGLLLALAGALITSGVACWSPPAGLVVAGVALAGWAWLFFGEVGGG